MKRVSASVFRFIMAILAFIIGVYALAYLIPYIRYGSPFIHEKGDLGTALHWNIFFSMHVLGGGLAILTGWSQFIRKMRNQRLQLHKTLGKIYWVSILVLGAPGGFYIAIFANGGFPNALGFGTLAVLWFYSTLRAYIYIRSKKIESHKLWMIRSYALTFAAITLRIWYPLFEFGLGIDHVAAYAAVAWFCWVPNLLFAEWVISKKWVLT